MWWVVVLLRITVRAATEYLWTVPALSLTVCDFGAVCVAGPCVSGMFSAASSTDEKREKAGREEGAPGQDEGNSVGLRLLIQGACIVDE